MEYPLLFLKRLLAAAVLPPGGPLLLAVFGLLLMRRAVRVGWLFAWIGVISSLLLSTPLAGNAMMRGLQTPNPVDLPELRTAQAIVVISADTNYDAREYGGSTSGALTLERLRYAARLARRSGLPILVSGGAPLGGRAEALNMREVLEREFGVAVRWTESASLDTRENARFAADILQKEKIQRIALVTHAWHMPRAQAYFEAAGFEVVPAATGWNRPSPTLWNELMPSPGGIRLSYDALREWMGRAAAALGTDHAR